MCVSVGVIGAGGIAEGIHLPCLRELPQVRLTAICDCIPEKARRLAAQFGVERVYENYRSMLEQEALDCIFVLVQPDQAFRIALDCLRAGKDVFVEKPPGITLYQAESLSAESTDRIVQVGFNRRYIQVVQQAVRRVRELSPVTHLSARFFKHGDAAFYDGCASAFTCDTIHSVDLLCWLADSEPDTAATVLSRIDSRVDNAWNSVMRFQNGITAVLQANYRTGGRVHDLELHGPGASAFVNLGMGGAGCEATILINRGYGGFSLAASGVGDFVTEHYDGLQLAGSREYHRYYGYFQEDEAFIRSVITRTSPLADLTAACRTMRTLDFLLRHAS